MTLKFKEITLKRISFKDIEVLRTWRNLENISKNMFFQKEISQQMQEKWFYSLNNKNDYYFIIIYKKEKIGLINIKNIEWQIKTGEAGLFIAIEKYKKTPLAFYSSLALLKYFFEEKKLENIIAKVKPKNLNIIEYNKNLGFEFLENNTYVLSREKYEKGAKRIIDLL